MQGLRALYQQVREARQVLLSRRMLAEDGDREAVEGLQADVLGAREVYDHPEAGGGENKHMSKKKRRAHPERFPGNTFTKKKTEELKAKIMLGQPRDNHARCEADYLGRLGR